MTIRQHLHLIPTTLVLGLALLATVPAQSNGEQEPNSAKTITAQQRLQNRLDALLSMYTELDKQLPQASSPAKAKRIWETITNNMRSNFPDFWDVEHDLEAVPSKEQKRFLAPYKNQLQPLRDKLNMQLDRLGIDRDWPRRTLGFRACNSFFEAWENLVQKYPEESDAAELFQQYLARLDNHDKLLTSIRTPNDRQRAEETICSHLDFSSKTEDDVYINELQGMLKKLPIETQKRLYAKYLPLIRNFLPGTPGKPAEHYHHLVYQSYQLLQYLSQEFEKLYTLQKAQENITVQTPDNIPAGMTEKETLVRQSIDLTNQLSNLLSTVTSKAAAAAAGPRAFDLDNRLRENNELLICADDVSPEEQARIDRAYGQLQQQAAAELNRQVQRLASKNSYRNTRLPDIVEDRSDKQNPQPQNSTSPATEQTEETQPEPES